MATNGFRKLGPGRYALTGPVGFRNAGDLLATSRALFAGDAYVQVDLSGVTEVDSAGLALLIEWLSQARRTQRVVTFSKVPEKLRSLARLSGVEEMLADGELRDAPAEAAGEQAKD